MKRISIHAIANGFIIADENGETYFQSIPDVQSGLTDYFAEPAEIDAIAADLKPEPKPEPVEEPIPTAAELRTEIATVCQSAMKTHPDKKASLLSVLQAHSEDGSMKGVPDNKLLVLRSALKAALK